MGRNNFSYKIEDINLDLSIPERGRLKAGGRLSCVFDFSWNSNFQMTLTDSQSHVPGFVFFSIFFLFNFSLIWIGLYLGFN